MDITINEEVLREHGLSLGEFLLLLIGANDICYEDCLASVLEKKLAYKNLYKQMSVVMDDAQKEKVASVVAAGDLNVRQSHIDFRRVARKLQELYPEGIKAGKTYSWRGTEEEIVYKLQALVAKYNFVFSEQECILATKRYLDQFKEDKKKMSILRNFILKKKPDEDGFPEMQSQLMSYIETIRDETKKEQENDINNRSEIPEQA